MPANREFYAAAGERLGHLRRFLGHEPDGMAAMIGMPVERYLKFETGPITDGDAWLDLAMALADAEAVSLDWLFRADGSRHPSFCYGHRRRPALRVVGGAA